MDLMDHVEVGLFPWQPNLWVVEVWHFYEVPRVGIFFAPEGTVLFTFLSEGNPGGELWGYLQLEGEGLEFALSEERFADTTALFDWVREQLTGRDVLLATVDNDRIVSAKMGTVSWDQ